jgi:hypothetical protein
MHDEFDELLRNISQKADKEVAQDDLDKVQEFLKKLVSQKAEIAKLYELTRNNFLNKLQDVVKNNFADLSIEDMGQFFNTVSGLVASAKKEEKKDAVVQPVADKKGAKDPEVKPVLKKPKKQHGFVKGMMHHGSGGSEHAGLPGALFGFAFATAIFVLIQELSDQSV